jgi:hypothetical protein
MASGAVGRDRKEIGAGIRGAMQKGRRERGGSMGSLEDMWKRKKEEEEDISLFRRNKMTPKSPREVKKG